MVKRFTLFVLLLAMACMPMAAVAAPLAQSSLADPSWRLTEYAVQRAAPVPSVGDPRPTLMFGTDGMVNGTTGCNSFNGTYAESGDQITFGPLASTRRVCVDPDVTTQEQLIFSVLSGTVAFTRVGETLTISAPAGMLSYVAPAIQPVPPTAAVPPQPVAPTEPVGMPVTGNADLGWHVLAIVVALLAIVFGIRLRHARRIL